jgi:hypothetical protein
MDPERLATIAVRVASRKVATDVTTDIEQGAQKLINAYNAWISSGETSETFEQDGYFALEGDIVFGIADGDILAMGVENGEVNDDPFYREPIDRFNAADCSQTYTGWVNEQAAVRELQQEQ